MARLPTVQDLGPRRVATPQRGMASVNNAGAAGRALTQVGGAIDNLHDVVFERQATASANERDVYVSTKLRELMYDPETGFTAQRGENAVAAQSRLMEQIDQLGEKAYDGLNSAARRKLEASITRRLEGARQTANLHTMGERDRWLEASSNARIESAYQDGIANLGGTSESLRVIESETRARAAREGWDEETTNVALQKANSGLITSQVDRIASSDPIAAMEYLRANQDRMRPSDVAAVEAALQPEVKRAVGRAIGREAFTGTGNMTAAIEIASDALGMNETAQRDALASYLKDGGTDLDPATTAWCAAFVNSTLAKAGMSGTGALNAKSFLEWGDEVNEPQRGDVVVLSRGDPNGWQGHVGFFDGYNDDGSIRLLGGNQGAAGEVSVQSFDASRVLGIRRQPADAGGVAEGMRAILEIQDPTERKAALDEFNLRVGIADGERKARLSAAQDAAFQHIESGGSPDDLPLEYRRSLGQEAMTSLRSYARSAASGVPVETDPGAYYGLRQMQVDDPAAFRDLNLMTYADRLSQTDLKGMIDAQQKPTSDITTVAASTLMTTANRHLRAAGFDTNANEGSADAKAVATLQTRILQWQDNYVANNNAAPSSLEINNEISRMLVPIAINPVGTQGGVGGLIWDTAKQSGSMFEINFDGSPLTEDDDLVVDDLRDGRLEIGGTQVSENVVQMAVDAYVAQFGRDPSAKEIVEGIVAAGIYE